MRTPLLSLSIGGGYGSKATGKKSNCSTYAFQLYAKAA
jgi:hypothetical protein